MGTATSVASVALGACVIEKHFIEDRSDKGPDSEFSLEPAELKTLCEETRIAWEAIGEVNYKRKGQEESNSVFRRSIYFSQNMKPKNGMIYLTKIDMKPFASTSCKKTHLSEGRTDNEQQYTTAH